MIPQLLTEDWETVRSHLERLHRNPPDDHQGNDDDPLVIINNLI